MKVYPLGSVQALSTKQVGVDAGVAVLVGPKREGDGGQIVDDGHGIAIPGQIDGA